MKRLKYISAFALLALMGLWSCSSDLQTANSSASHGKGHKVSLTIGSNAKTRTAAPTSLGGFDREKAIDGNKLYAVVFDQQGKFFETIKITDYNSGDGTCSFTLSDAGVYYGYIIANTSKGTALTGLTVGTSTEDDLFNIIEDTDPGTNLAASTNFLMTSKRTLLDVDGDADTALGTVTLTRAVARIDIDVTAVDGLAITEVKVENRYKKSLTIRGNSPADATLTAATPTDTKTYTRGTSSGQVAALSDGTGLVNDQQWQGVIYGYENINTNTIVTITHTLNGVASQTIVDFADANSGAGQALKRNNIYTVKLTSEVLTPTLQNIVSTITVVDWDNSVNLAYTDLTDHEKPDYIVTSGHLAFGFTSESLNPNQIMAVYTDIPTEILLEITSHGKVASEVSFVDKNGVAFDFLGISGTSIGQVGETTYVDGNIVQNYKITIPQDVILNMKASDYFTFKVHNVFDDTSTGSREFVVKGKNVRMNPLWWIAKYNIAEGWNDFDYTENTSQGFLYNWTHCMASKYSAQDTSYDGWRIPSGTGKTIADRTITVTNGKEETTSWHLGTLQEWYTIVPAAATANILSNSTFAADGTVKSEVACVFGYDATTQTPTAYKSYWGTAGTTRYAIRFIGTDFCSAWRYQILDVDEGNTNVTNARVVISSRLIDRIEETELSKLSTELTAMSGGDATYWNEDNLSENAGGVIRTFYLSGHGSNGGTETQAPGVSWPNSALTIHMATKNASNVPLFVRSHRSEINMYPGAVTYPMSIRLIRDN